MKVFLAIAFMFIFVGVSFADNNETFTVDSWELHGCFNKPCTLTPSGTTFNLLFIYNNGVGIAYDYLGRTGEKTFDLLFKPTNKNEKTIYHIYFTPNDSINLQGTSGMFPKQGCTENDGIALKMLDLTGNQLKYQIILPDCLKGKLKK